MDLTTAMVRYERARTAAVRRDGAEPTHEQLAELAAARLAVVGLLTDEGWMPEPRVSEQLVQDRALLAEDAGA